jgi:hypothetical protein
MMALRSKRDTQWEKGQSMMKKMTAAAVNGVGL